MILKRDALQAAAALTDRRGPLHHIQVTPDGEVHGTDGKIAIIIRSRCPGVDTEFPTVPGADADGQLSVPVCLDVAHVQKLVTGTARKSTIPILDSIRVGQDTEGVVATATDLSSHVVIRIPTDAVTGPYPNIARVLPAENRPSVQITLGTPAIKKLLAALQHLDAHSVTLHVAAEDAQTQPVIRIELETVDFTAVGAMAQCRK